MVVLDNKLTASASEIFSAAMQDYGRAVIVGDSSSFGKGTVQALIGLGEFMHGHDDPVHSGGALKITMQKIYRLTGKSTQLKGIIPDVTIPSLTDQPEFGEIDRGGMRLRMMMKYPLLWLMPLKITSLSSWTNSEADR